MATPDLVAAAEATLSAAVDQLHGSNDPATLLTVGRLHTRLEAIRALAPHDPSTADILADDLTDAIRSELGERGPTFARHATRGAQLLGTA